MFEASDDDMGFSKEHNDFFGLWNQHLIDKTSLIDIATKLFMEENNRIIPIGDPL